MAETRHLFKFANGGVGVRKPKHDQQTFRIDWCSKHRSPGVGHAATEHSVLVARTRHLSTLTLVWLLIDGVIGMTAGLTANSVALIGWGLDFGIAAIAAIAAVVISWRFTGIRIHSADAERRAQQVVAVSFFLLAPYVLVEAIDYLITWNKAGSSWLGVALAATDAVLMPSLGIAKKRLGAHLGSFATTADGTQNLLCQFHLG